MLLKDAIPVIKQRKSWTDERLAEHCRVSIGTIMRWKNGYPPKMLKAKGQLRRLCAELGLEVEELS